MPPITHIVLFRWRPDTSAQAIDAVVEGLQELPARVPGILELEVGANFSDRSQGYELALLVRFADRAALEAYGRHPDHLKVVEERIKPHLDSLVVADYEALPPRKPVR